MLEILGAIVGGVVAGAVGGWIAGAKSARSALAVTTRPVSTNVTSPSSADPVTTPDVSATPDVVSPDHGGDVQDAEMPRLLSSGDPTASIDIVPAHDDRRSAVGGSDAGSDHPSSVAASMATSADVLIDSRDPVIDEAAPSRAELTIELEEVGRGYFDLVVVNSGDGVAEGVGVEITKTGSGGFSYLPTDGDVGDIGCLGNGERRPVGQIVRTGGNGLLVVTTAWTHPDGTTGEDECAFE